MGLKRSHLKSESFVYTLAFGKISNQNLMEHVIALNNETQDIPDFLELADCRQIESVDELSVQGTISSSNLEISRPESKLAILVPEDKTLIFGLARTYQMFSEEKRKAVIVTNKLEEALNFLFEDKDLTSVLEFIEQSSTQS